MRDDLAKTVGVQCGEPVHQERLGIMARRWVEGADIWGMGDGRVFWMKHERSVGVWDWACMSRMPRIPTEYLKSLGILVVDQIPE